ncbi:MAG: septal ring lytic transglycosylase RlpA family protein [Chitinophagaceae bacterium]
MLGSAVLYVVFPFCLALTSCTCNETRSPEAGRFAVKETRIGLASFYSHSFQGGRTANGETFNNKHLVAAHPSYPFGTVVRVTHIRKGRVVKVRILDRGPTRRNRSEGVIIDLSREAAKKLGMVKQGRAKVKVEVLEWGKKQQ